MKQLYNTIKNRWGPFDRLHLRESHGPLFRWYVWTGQWERQTQGMTRMLESYPTDSLPPGTTQRSSYAFSHANGWMEAVHTDKLSFLVLTGVELDPN